MEDEWLVVALLMHLTKRFPDISARVWDNDGEFLLIEAAYALPKWLRPETAEQRQEINACKIKSYQFLQTM